ncbi:hypothetical protein HY485_04620 [Candidatus Woesearchaeota archaeon]|nr:hypothetical protein [Candidatus Woesearchaeota archaeon]
MGLWSMSDDLVEVVVLFVLILSFFLSVFTNSFATKLILIFVVGLMFGRAWFLFRKKTKLALTAIVAGFLLGFLLGNLFENIRELTILFLAGFFLAYYAHEKKWVMATS